jgi:hypothetical protein
MVADKSLTAVFVPGISLQTTLKNQAFSSERIKQYSFTLLETTSIAILSGDSLDVKARVLDSNGNAVLDENGSEFCDDYMDIGSVSQNGHLQTNFMYRKQNLVAGTYILEVTPKDDQTPIVGNFSIVFLKKPANSAEFFAGMDALLDDDDTSNDYLDIYVKALYPEFYSTVDDVEAYSNYHECLDDTDHNVKAERQCKALVNFYLHEILGNGYLEGDTYIQSTNWTKFDDADSNCVADSDYIMTNNADGILIYHSTDSFGSSHNCPSGDYFYRPGESSAYRGVGNLKDYVSRGDVFVKTGHYGLIYGYDETVETVKVLDANWADPMDGKIRKGTATSRDSESWKVTRPQ